MRKPEENQEFTPAEREFARLMQNAFLEQVEKDGGLPEVHIDYSFMDEYENVVTDREEKKHNFRKSLARVAVILLVFFCGISVAVFSDLPSSANAWKTQMARRLYVLKEGYLSTDENVSVNYTDENTMTVVIDDFDKIAKARNVAPGLPIPNYITNGYKFNKLTIDITYDGSYNAIYRFVNDGLNNLYVNVYYNPKEEKATLNIDNVVEMIETNEKTVCVWEDKIEESKGVTVYKQYYTIDIIADIDKNELIMIANELN